MATDRDLQRYRRRGTTTERGLGSRHQKLSKDMRAAAGGQPCPGPWSGRRSRDCTGILLAGRMQLDDRVPRAEGGRSYVTGARVCCTSCNTSAGAQYGNARRRRHPSRANRTCIACGRGYTATWTGQRTCGRTCGQTVRRRVGGAPPVAPGLPPTRTASSAGSATPRPGARALPTY